jgi:hypothetical protein
MAPYRERQNFLEIRALIKSQTRLPKDAIEYKCNMNVCAFIENTAT